MLVLLDNGQDLAQCATELGLPVGQLLTPLTRYHLRNRALPWAIDNGAFSDFDEDAFLSLLKREWPRAADCLFVTAPDVVASARRTLEIFERWRERLGGWRVALVCQDGQEHLPIPWDDIDAIFIGGSTAWKCSPAAEQIIRAAKILKKHVHVGRVNTPSRFRHFEEIGVDSVDGSGIARYSHMRQAVARRHDQGWLL
ncbi:MAG TPA: hypothetical protein VGP94_13995 [Tepidisphaeraceae bacterium]|jgi:hypothetical protein|nr:hypothetical protein [Tepidisphaeraceae bacterium]